MSTSSWKPAFLSLSAAHDQVRVIPPYEPPSWKVILLMRRNAWDAIITGEKTLEIREQRLKSQCYLVGRHGQIWGSLVLEPGQVIETDEEWRALLQCHGWHIDTRPYKKTYALPIKNVESFSSPLEYAPVKGQRGIAKYRPLPKCHKTAMLLASR